MHASISVIDIPRGKLNWTNKRVFSKFLCNLYGNRAISSADIQDKPLQENAARNPVTRVYGSTLHPPGSLLSYSIMQSSCFLASH